MAKIFHSKGYKVTMSFVYGWGATAVIIGALFKIMHFPGAGTILCVGMIVEAIIFALSSFEPQTEHYDWARVFPVLGKSHSEWDKNGEAIGMCQVSQPTVQNNYPVASGNVTQVSGNIDLGLDEADINKLRAGINKIADAADSFAEIGTNVPTVTEFTKKMAKASASFEELGEKTQQVGEVLQSSVQGFADGCGEINRVLLGSTEKLTLQIKDNCDKLASNMGHSADHFQSLNKIMEEQVQHVKSQSENYTQQISAVNKNISALNALYELQIHETKGCLESFRGMQGDMGEMLESVSLSLDSAKLFKQESQQLASNVASLNSVYGNMLSVVNNN